MIARTVLQILRHGYNTLKTAVVGGQYDFPKGLFFGGDELQAAPRTLLAELPSLLEGANKSFTSTSTPGSARAAHTLCWSTPMRGAHSTFAFVTRTETAISPWDADHGGRLQDSERTARGHGETLWRKTDVITCEFGTLPP